jgi:hypothetical protein
MRGGQPSITTPMPPPCDSPKVVTRKSWPNVLDMTRKNKARFADHNAQILLTPGFSQVLLQQQTTKSCFNSFTW